MLDDLNYIAQIDADNSLAVTAGQCEQLNYSNFDAGGINKRKINNVVLAGMGGSALAGLICQNWLNISVPFQVVREYSLPEYVGKDTLVIVSSYSGNTEESLEMLKAAHKKRALIVAITSGGVLERAAKKQKYPVLKMPENYQQRMTTFFQIKLITAVLEAVGLVSGAIKQLEDAYTFVSSEAQKLIPQIETKNNQAKQIAEELLGKTPIIYAGPSLASAAYKWKISFNENAKNTAWCGVLPEFNHNEFVGWSSHPVEKPFGVIKLRSNLDHKQVQKSFDLTNKLLSGQMPKAVEVNVKGSNHIKQLLGAVQLGDFVSIYLAVLNNVNPTPVRLIEKLKKEL
ncbi:MAG: bifunctional phosphoglucose/phosphomannose isomerase [Candidatus Saccharimonadales bacterium]